jgi:hypothetical protein
MPKLPNCAWLLIGSLIALMHHTIGLAATIGFLLAATLWVLNTPAALVAIASLAAWHLTSCHTPRTARR